MEMHGIVHIGAFFIWGAAEPDDKNFLSGYFFNQAQPKIILSNFEREFLRYAITYFLN